MSDQPVLFVQSFFTVQILCIGTDRSQQTVQTKIRLLLKKQSDQGLRCVATPSASFGCINAMYHETFLLLGQLMQLFEVSQILEFLRYISIPPGMLTVTVKALASLSRCRDRFEYLLRSLFT